MKAGALVFGFALAFLAESLPLGPFYAQLHPDFIALFILYWALSSSDPLSYFVIWLIGLAQDLIFAHVPGSNAISLVLMLALLYAWIARVRRLPPWEQLFFIFFLLLVQSVSTWLWQAWVQPLAWHNSLLLSAALGAALWPLFTYLLDRLQHYWPIRQR